MLKTCQFLFYSEILLKWRNKADWLFPICFFLILFFLFPVLFSVYEEDKIAKLLPGCIWISALFASLLSIQNMFSSDLEDRHLEQLILSELPMGFIIYLKLFSHWIFSQLPLVVISIAFLLIFNYSFYSILIMMIALFLGSIILTVLGSFLVALTIGLAQQGILMGLIFFPLVSPVVILGVNIMLIDPIQGDPFVPLAFLASLSLLSLTLLPLATTIVLKMSVE